MIFYKWYYLVGDNNNDIKKAFDYGTPVLYGALHTVGVEIKRFPTICVSVSETPWIYFTIWEDVWLNSVTVYSAQGETMVVVMEYMITIIIPIWSLAGIISGKLNDVKLIYTCINHLKCPEGFLTPLLLFFKLFNYMFKIIDDWLKYGQANSK